ncbi:Apses transcription [Mycena kentingensis (nom. inval.)]|nr:Apses transcription [Mycena kentingensis (nom. inval.)]
MASACLRPWTLLMSRLSRFPIAWNMPRPALPSDLANLHIVTLLKEGTMPQVKYQHLNVQGGQEILVGRLKVETPTPSGHAFILRRFDTGAVSLTTMFRAAYPTADPEAEKRELQWVKENYDLTSQNGSTREPTIPRLAGTWVNKVDAVELGTAYGLGELIHIVARAAPDPNVDYRRAGKNAKTPSRPAALPTPPPPGRASPNPPAAKRRKEKESSPAPAPAATPARSSMVVSPRRSTRAKSPRAGSQPAPMPSLSSVIKPPSKKTMRRGNSVTASDMTRGSDETAVEDESGVGAVEDAASGDLRKQDVAEQRELIAKLKKAQREEGAPTTVKRAREDEDKALEFTFKEPEVGERRIATNSRINSSQRTALWGTLAFAFGAALTFAPSVISNYL